MTKHIFLSLCMIFSSIAFSGTSTSYANYSTDFDDEVRTKRIKSLQKNISNSSRYQRRGTSRTVRRGTRGLSNTRGIASSGSYEVAQAPTMASPMTGADIPANAQPGQCFTKIIIPAKYSTTKERIVVSPETSRVSTIPAKYGYEERRILVQEASERHVTIPATYKWVQERVQVVDQSESLVKIPAQYKTVPKKIMVSAATTEWKKGDNSGGGVNNEALCLVQKPAVYKTVYEKVEVSPARTESKVIPAQFQTVKKRIIERPAQVKAVPVPAQYKTVKVRKMIEPPRTVQNPIPAKYDFVNKRVMVQDSKTVWAEILCKTNANQSTVARVQQALTRSGYRTGGTDGRLGPTTYRAIESFQRSKGLMVGGGLTMETLRALNIQM